MDNTLSALLMAVLLVVGIVGGGMIFPREVEKECPVCDICEECEAPIECDICEETTDYLQLAVDEFLVAVDDEEDEAGNEVDALLDYDFDEISVSKVYDDYTISYDGDETTVNFEIKLKYDEDGEKSEKHRYNVEVIFEYDEDTLVTIV